MGKIKELIMNLVRVNVEPGDAPDHLEGEDVGHDYPVITIALPSGDTIMVYQSLIDAAIVVEWEGNPDGIVVFPERDDVRGARVYINDGVAYGEPGLLGD